jgi:hypothetical protein
MTGLFIRIYRDDSWQDLEIDELTDDELEGLRGRSPFEGWPWAIALAKWIRDNVNPEARA